VRHAPIPVTILTGFLGSGKTCLLNRLLKNPLLGDAMVLINELGEVSIDHLLVERSDDADMMIELSNGCLCCTLRGDLVDRLSDLLVRMAQGHLKKISRLLIETTGLADPIPILQLFMTHPLLLKGFHHDGVITVVDAIHGLKTLDHYEEARRQVALADQIVVSKGDLLIDEDRRSLLLARLAKLNKTAEIVITQPGQDMDISLLQCGLKGLEEIRPHVHSPSEHHDHDHDHLSHHDEHDKNRHGETIRSFCLTHDRPLPIALIEGFLDHLSAHYGANILRLKGIVETVERPDQPLILHAAQGFSYPLQWLADWGLTNRTDQTRQTHLVVIVDGISHLEIETLFNAFVGRIGVDQVDFQALTDNPLAIPGLKF